MDTTAMVIMKMIMIMIMVMMIMMMLAMHTTTRAAIRTIFVKILAQIGKRITLSTFKVDGVTPTTAMDTTGAR